ncbi:MAG: PAS domain S-box protein, partial [Alphaproteobacteria bacterium]
MRTIDSVEGEADRRRLLDLARVFDHLPTGFCVFDAELRYVYVNGALAALSGLPSEDHIGRTFHEMLPRVAQSVETELRQVLTTGKFFAGGVVEAETSAASGVKQAFQHSAAAVWGEDNEFIGLSCLVHDVTSQRRTRDALQQSEESLELSLDAAPIGTWSWDLIDDTHFWDSRMLSMSGHSAEEYTGVMSDDFMASLHPDDVAKVEEAVRRSLEDGAEYNIDYRIIRRNDGEVRDMNARALVIRDDGGKAVRMTGVAIDVTERKRSEAELRQAHASLEERIAERTQTLNDANQRLQDEIAERNLAEAARLEGETFIDTVMSNMVDALITIDMSGDVSSFNQAAEIIFGYISTEVIGQNIRMLMPEPDHSRHDGYLSDYMDTGHSTIINKGPREVLGRHKDGRTLNLELAISRTSFGGQPLFVGSLRDISERLQLEALFKIVAEHTPNSIILRDLEGRFVLVNRRYEQWLGLSPGEVLGKTVSEVYPARQAEVTVADDREVARGGEICTQELDVEFADGEVHRILSTKFPVTDANGVVIGVGAVGMDVSELRRVESQLLQAQKMEAIGQLTGGIAHDFNNLLAVMMGNLSLLREDLGPDHQFASLLEPTMRAINQAAALTARMLAFSRQQSLEVRQVDANALLRDMQPLIKRSLAEQIEITFVLAPNVYHCQVDPVQLEQAILNLSINARDAMPRGGHLRIETANVTLDADDKKRPIERPPGDYVRIS